MAHISRWPNIRRSTVTRAWTGFALAIRPALLQIDGVKDVDSKISDAVKNAPLWVRRDLLSDDKLVRVRAEETLAAMIANALAAAPRD